MPDISSWSPSFQIAALVGTVLAFFAMAILGRRTKFNFGSEEADDEAAKLRAQLRDQILIQRENDIKQEIKDQLIGRISDVQEDAKQDYAELELRVRAIELTLAEMGRQPRRRKLPGDTD